MRKIYFKAHHSCLYCSHGSQCENIIAKMREAQQAMLKRIVS